MAINKEIQRAERPFNRLSDTGREVLNPTPKVVFMKVDSKTGEVIQDGFPRPPTLQDTLRLAMARGRGADDYGLYDVEDEDDFDTPEDDGSLPLHSPHTEGFVDALGPSVPAAIKQLQKAGYSVYKPKGDALVDEAPASPPKTKKKAPAHPIAGEPSTPMGGDDE